MLTAEINQSKLPVGARLTKRGLQQILDTIARAVGKKADGILSVAFIGEKEMRRLNRDYREIDKVTDVLAFEYDGETLGEVLICYPQAKRQAAERGHNAKQEVSDLLIHGILHVLGYDHIKDKDADVMLPLQKKIYGRIARR